MIEFSNYKYLLNKDKRPESAANENDRRRKLESLFNLFKLLFSIDRFVCLIIKRAVLLEREIKIKISYMNL